MFLDIRISNLTMKEFYRELLRLNNYLNLSHPNIKLCRGNNTEIGLHLLNKLLKSQLLNSLRYLPKFKCQLSNMWVIRHIAFYMSKWTHIRSKRYHLARSLKICVQFVSTRGIYILETKLLLDIKKGSRVRAIHS